MIRTGEEVAAAVTDAQGRWESDALTAAEAARREVRLCFEFWLTHPDYVAAIPEISIEQARARNSVQTMKRGGSLSGKVAGPDGRPIAGAWVVADQNTGNGISAHTETDDTGQFRFGRCLDPQGSPVVLTVLAPGLAAHSRTLLAAADIPAQVIQLDGAPTLARPRGRLPGPSVAGAVVESTRFFRERQVRLARRDRCPGTISNGRTLHDGIDRAGRQKTWVRRCDHANFDSILATSPSPCTGHCICTGP